METPGIAEMIEPSGHLSVCEAIGMLEFNPDDYIAALMTMIAPVLASAAKQSFQRTETLTGVMSTWNRPLWGEYRLGGLCMSRQRNILE